MKIVTIIENIANWVEKTTNIITPKIIEKEYFEYYSNKTPPEFLEQIQSLIEEKNEFLNSNIDLMGAFIDKDEFKFAAKSLYTLSSMILIGEVSMEPTFLHGFAIKDEKHPTKTKVIFYIQLKGFYKLLYILVSVFAVPFFVGLYPVFTFKQCLVFIIVVLILISLSLILGFIAKHSLNERFVETFKLKSLIK